MDKALHVFIKFALEWPKTTRNIIKHQSLPENQKKKSTKLMAKLFKPNPPDETERESLVRLDQEAEMPKSPGNNEIEWADTYNEVQRCIDNKVRG